MRLPHHCKVENKNIFHFTPFMVNVAEKEWEILHKIMTNLSTSEKLSHDNNDNINTHLSTIFLLKIWRHSAMYVHWWRNRISALHKSIKEKLEVTKNISVNIQTFSTWFSSSWNFLVKFVLKLKNRVFPRFLSPLEPDPCCCHSRAIVSKSYNESRSNHIIAGEWC